MKKIAAILLIFYFGLGAIVLPMGDFSLLPDIPEMYHQCKHTEHDDMDAFEFLTDHLINIDGIFDKHGPGDDQKPHQPFDFQHHLPAINLAFTVYHLDFSSFDLNVDLDFPKLNTHIPSAYISDVFRPPIV